MKYKHILQLLMPSILTVPFCIFIVSCSSSSVPFAQEHYDFINDRTFAISGPAVDDPGYISLGTAWILDSVKDSNHPYEYYLMSNYHVMGAWIETQTPFDKLYFYSKTPDSNFANKPDCSIDVIFNAKLPNTNYSEYLNDFNDQQSHYLLSSATNYRFDMAVFKYDFQNSLNSISTNAYSKTQLKNRLDNLNQESLNHTVPITKTYNKIYPFNSGQHFYYLGFPYSDVNNSPILKMNTFKIVNRYVARNNLSPNDGDVNVPSKPVYNSDEYLANYDANAWGGGSSGSMIINENYEVIGLHAGSRGTIYQRTVMFENSITQSNYNFIERFYNWKLNN